MGGRARWLRGISCGVFPKFFYSKIAARETERDSLELPLAISKWSFIGMEFILLCIAESIVILRIFPQQVKWRPNHSTQNDFSLLRSGFLRVKEWSGNNARIVRRVIAESAITVI